MQISEKQTGYAICVSYRDEYLSGPAFVSEGAVDHIMNLGDKPGMPPMLTPELRKAKIWDREEDAAYWQEQLSEAGLKDLVDAIRITEVRKTIQYETEDGAW